MAVKSRGSRRVGWAAARLARLPLLVLLATTLAACGGGSTGDSASAAAASIRKADAVATASPFLGQSLFDGKPASIGITELIKVSERRVTRTVWEYEFKASVRNIGGDAQGVSLDLSQVPSGTTVVAGAVAVGDLAGGATVTPAQVIKIRTDRLLAFDAAQFVWTLSVIDGVVGASDGTVTPGGSVSLDSLLTADFQGQSALNGTQVNLRRLRSASLNETLDRDGLTYGLVRRPDDTFEIQIDKAPAAPGLKVSLLVPGYSAAELDQQRVPAVMALRALAGDDDDGDDSFVTLDSTLDPAALRVATVIPSALFAQQPDGRFTARVRVSIVQGFSPTTSQAAGTKQAAEAGTSRRAATSIGAGTPIRCPVVFPDGCVEVSMYGNRVKAGSTNVNGTLHKGIDLRGNGHDVLGVPGAKVVAFRTVEDANAGFGGGTGAIVVLQLGRVTYKYMHLGGIRQDILDCKGSFKADASRLYQVGSTPCKFAPTASSALIGKVGGTGAGAGNPHLHFEIFDTVGRTCAYIDSEKVQRCWSTLTAADPFPYLLSKLSFANPPPGSVATGASIAVGVKGEDVNGTPVTSEIEPAGSPVGNQRYLCATEGANGRLLDFTGGPYGLVRRAPGPTSGPLEHTSVANLGWNTKCRLWNGGTRNDGFFAFTPSKAGNAILDVYYTDQNVEKTALASRPFATASLNIASPTFRGNVAVSGPAAITGSACSGTMTVTGEVFANLGATPTLTFNGTEAIALSCYSQSVQAGATIPLTIAGTRVSGTVVQPFTCGPPCVSGQSVWTVDLQLVSVGGVQSLQGTFEHTNQNQTPFFARSVGTIAVPQSP